MAGNGGEPTLEAAFCRNGLQVHGVGRGGKGDHHIRILREIVLSFEEHLLSKNVYRKVRR